MAIKNATRKKIFDTALLLFNEHGYENVTIANICDRADVTRNAFYYYYKSKDDLIRRYFIEVLEDDDAILNDIFSFSNDFERLMFIYNSFIKSTQAIGVELLKQLYILNLSAEKGAFTQHKYESLCISLIRNCQNSGLITNSDTPENLHILCNQIMHGVVIYWLIIDSSVNVITQTENIIKRLLSNTEDL